MNAHFHPALARRPDVGAHLCQLVGEWRADTAPPEGWLVEEKIDGWRGLWIDGELVTREGATVYGCERVAAACRSLEKVFGRNMFFDGELQIGGSYDLTARHLSARGRAEESGEVVMHLFDAMPMDAWHGRAPCLPLRYRRQALEAAMHDRYPQTPALELVPVKYMRSARDVEAYARTQILAGKEGVVVKDARSVYLRDRGPAWRRIKRVMTADLRVIAVLPQPKRSDRLGTLLCDQDGVTVRVTAGFTAEQRETLWRSRARLVGSVIEVEAMDKTPSGSLRQARFVRVREDKGNG